jgi:hypothetical protein
LVGKTIAINESTRYNPEFVRINIACREVEVVPKCAEGDLGMFIYDFLFEREDLEGMKNGKQKEAIRVETPRYQLSPKKMKTSHEIGSADKGGESNYECSGKKYNEKVSSWSAPAKTLGRREDASDLEEGEVIPAANYESSDSSVHFPRQVNKLLDGGVV